VPHYFFHIFAGHPFKDDMGEHHPNEESAWRDALRLVRDIEQTLKPGGEWTLRVVEDEKPILEIEVKARHLGS
jgi:hypothetical protein